MGFIMAQTDKNEKKVATEAQPNAVFGKTEHDFGNIQEGIPATAEFEFLNTGDAPLIIISVYGSCTTNWSRDSIAPGATGKITAVYNTSGRPGYFTKSITVRHNGEETIVHLFIKGNVEPTIIEPDSTLEETN